MKSIKDVAKLAGVSISTVSHVIHGTKFVSSDLQKKVHLAIQELDYQVNPMASGLKSKSTKSIGVIVPNMNRIFFSQVIKGIQEVCTPKGYNFTLCDTNDDLARERYSLNMLQQSWADGVILDSVADDGDSQYFKWLSQLQSSKRKPCIVSLERVLGDLQLDAVYVNNFKGGQIATQHLLDCHCKHIVHITGPEYARMVQDRLEGYKQVLTESRTCKPRVFKGDFSPASGYQCMKKALQLKTKVDGVFAANDQMAIGAVAAIKEAGLKIPQDMKIVGFDNAFVAGLVSPSLTTVHVPKYRMGKTAAQLLLKRLAGDDQKPKQIELPIELNVRESTCGKGEAKIELADW